MDRHHNKSHQEKRHCMKPYLVRVSTTIAVMANDEADAARRGVYHSAQGMEDAEDDDEIEVAVLRPITNASDLTEKCDADYVPYDAPGGATLGDLIGKMPVAEPALVPGGPPTMPLAGASWIAHAYPLQQIRIELQGTRHSDRAAVIDQLETVLARLRDGELSGGVDDDDFGYRFVVDGNSAGPSFFDGPARST